MKGRLEGEKKEKGGEKSGGHIQGCTFLTDSQNSSMIVRGGYDGRGRGRLSCVILILTAKRRADWEKCLARGVVGQGVRGDNLA